jgi:eukaryotic-like serine/threonine-protein kinase
MSVEPQATPNWKALEGRVLEGGYEIQTTLWANPQAAVFKIRILGDRFTKAVVRVSAPGLVPPEHLALWHEAVRLRHPNVSAPLATGETFIDGVGLAYLVLVTPDETLADALKERALTPDEMRAVIFNALDGLEYLHANGLVLATMGPGNVHAIGDGVKLAISHLRRINSPLGGAWDLGDRSSIYTELGYVAPESTTGNITQAADMFCLGATIFEIVARRPCGDDGREQAKTLRAPYNRILEGCLLPDPPKRLKLPEVRVLMRGGRLTPAEPIPVTASTYAIAASTTAPAPIPAAAPVSPAPDRPAVKPILVEVPLIEDEDIPFEHRQTSAAPLPIPPPRLLPTEKKREWLASKAWLYVLAFAVLGACLIVLARPRKSALPASQPAAQANWPSHTVGPGGETAQKPLAGPAQAPAQTPAKTPATPTGDWRVIVYTFQREEDAERRAEKIRAAHAALAPEVFSPSGKGAPYLIVLRGRMTRAEAERLRQQARSSGMPRDTYIQNYNH